MNSLNLYFDDSYKDGFSCLCGVVVFNKENTLQVVQKCIDDISGGVLTHHLDKEIKRLKTIGFHYCDDSYLIRELYIDEIGTLSGGAEVVVAYRRLSDSEIILQIIRVIKVFAQKYSNKNINVFIENGNFTSNKLLKDINETLNSVNIINISAISIASKHDEPVMSTADYIAGVVRDYYLFHVVKVKPIRALKLKLVEILGFNLNGDKAVSKQQYEKLKRKIRCVHDLDTGKYESRRQRVRK